MIDYYKKRKKVVEIDGEKSIKEVFEDIVTVLK